MAAAITDKFKKGYGFFSTTLSAQKNSGASSMSLSDATGVPTTTGLVFTVGRVNSSGTSTPSTRAIYKGTLSGTTVSNLTLTEGTDQTHAAGTVVEITFTATHWNDAVDGILVEHNQDGTHAAITATSANVSGTVTTDTIAERTSANGVTIDGLNIKDGALNTNNSVVTANIANNAVTSAKLKAAQTDSTPGSLSDIGTSYSTGATLSVTAGTYLLIARATCVTSVAQATSHVCEIYNSTDASILDTQTIRSEYLSGTQIAYLNATNIVITTLASTKTIIARYKVDDSAGSSSVEDIKLIAIPVGV